MGQGLRGALEDAGLAGAAANAAGQGEALSSFRSCDVDL